MDCWSGCGTVPSMTLNCSSTARSFWFSLIEQSDVVEVCERPGILHDSVLCRLHGRWEQDWWRNVNPEHRIWCQTPVHWPGWWSVCCSLRVAALRAENIELGTHCKSRVNVLTSAEVTDLLPELNLAHDQGNRTTLSLSPSRTPTEVGLEVSLDSQEWARPHSGLELLTFLRSKRRTLHVHEQVKYRLEPSEHYLRQNEMRVLFSVVNLSPSVPKFDVPCVSTTCHSTGPDHTSCLGSLFTSLTDSFCWGHDPPRPSP